MSRRAGSGRRCADGTPREVASGCTAGGTVCGVGVERVFGARCAAAVHRAGARVAHGAVGRCACGARAVPGWYAVRVCGEDAFVRRRRTRWASSGCVLGERVRPRREEGSDETRGRPGHRFGATDTRPQGAATTRCTDTRPRRSINPRAPRRPGATNARRPRAATDYASASARTDRSGGTLTSCRSTSLRRSMLCTRGAMARSSATIQLPTRRKRSLPAVMGPVSAKV